jgi:hypothetical protein
MAACGFTEAQIAVCVGDDGIDVKTLRRHFRRQLDVSHIKANAKVAGELFQAATVRKEPWAICFWMKVRAGWREGGAGLRATDPSGKELFTLETIDDLIKRADDQSGAKKG